MHTKFLRAECLQCLKPYSFLIGLSYHSFKTQRHVNGCDGAGGTVEVVINVVNEAMNIMIKTAVFFSLHTDFLYKDLPHCN